MPSTADSGQPTDDTTVADDRPTAAEELPRPVLVGTHVALRLARARV